MRSSKGFKIEKYLVELLFILAVVSMVLFTDLASKAYAEIEYWNVEAGGKVLAVLPTEASADMAMDQIEQHYTRDGAYDVRVKIEPEITVKQEEYEKDEAPKRDSVKSAVDKTIAEAENGDSIMITTTQVIAYPEEIKAEDVVRKTSKLIEDAREYTENGKAGSKLITKEITTVNGKTVDTEILDTEVIKKAKDNMVLVGTRKDNKEDSPSEYGSAGRAFHVKSAGGTFKADLSGEKMGKKVADYGLVWVGNPYVYGGTSLTKGADCSGFTLSVYRHFGISLPHNANTQRNYGKGVSLKNARPGDLVCFPGHVGIYIGNNRIVHAMNAGNGITTSTIGYSGKPVVAVRRLFA